MLLHIGLVYRKTWTQGAKAAVELSPVFPTERVLTASMSPSLPRSSCTARFYFTHPSPSSTHLNFNPACYWPFTGLSNDITALWWHTMSLTHRRVTVVRDNYSHTRWFPELWNTKCEKDVEIKPKWSKKRGAICPASITHNFWENLTLVQYECKKEYLY